MACFVAIGCANGASRSILNQSTRAASGTPARATTTKVTRTKNQNIVSRSAKPTKTSARTAITQKSGTRTTRDKQQTTHARTTSWLTPIKRVIGRAANNTETSTVTPNPGFGADYTNCRDAYFTCMDQFCANMNETYRRCVCSSRLNEIKQKQSTLSHTADSLQEFKDLNLEVINKSTEEVRAMMSATAGEQIAATAKDKSDSAQQLSAIGDVLSKARNKSLSNAGTLDVGGDIKAIWATTELANGANIANLTGEKLFNAVNAQCSTMVAEQCTPTVLDMVISAYGMHIENDCAALATDLGKKKNAANSTIRETQREMNVARLDNYDAHNSLPINDCIAGIRQDLMNDMACGPDFVHCWDVTGLYLTIDKGEPIYSAKFYNLENQISLSGNILNNKTNNVIVAALNNKKMFAEKTLDKCRDLSASVWDEFMRQAIIEIRQKQQEKIRAVKTECLGVVNECYDNQTQSLKEFNDSADKTLLGQTMETVEDLCQEKLDTCSNLYGGGPDGLASLVNVMRNIVNQRIVAECQNFLIDFGKNLCTVQSTDTIHSYPYACRVYDPGEQQVATPNNPENTLYQRFVNYAMQVCIRPSEYETINNDDVVPTEVLQEVNMAMGKMRIAMNTELAKECERLGGEWVSNPYQADSNSTLYEKFYTDTGSNTNWGYCREPVAAAQTYTITFDNDNNSSTIYTAVVTYGEPMSPVTPPYLSGCSFKGYFTQPHGAGVLYYKFNGNATRAWDISSDATLYAAYSCSITYICYHGNDQTGQTCPLDLTQSLPLVYRIGTDTLISVPQYTNFLGWKLQGDPEITPSAVTISAGATGNQTVYGYFSE
ncbi:MAG: hypothetical protein J5608_03395 [Alphaproteobacteria bacterium]|nr:hypothetical protein [Alphaproteobacteria bacterium]